MAHFRATFGAIPSPDFGPVSLALHKAPCSVDTPGARKFRAPNSGLGGLHGPGAPCIFGAIRAPERLLLLLMMTGG